MLISFQNDGANQSEIWGWKYLGAVEVYINLHVKFRHPKYLNTCLNEHYAEKNLDCRMGFLDVMPFALYSYKIRHRGRQSNPA